MSIIKSGPRELGYAEGFKEARDQLILLLQKEIDNAEWYEAGYLIGLQDQVKKLTP